MPAPMFLEAIKVTVAALSLIWGVVETGVFRKKQAVETFAAVKKNKDFYYGEGLVSDMNAHADARADAKERAIRDLAQNIQVTLDAKPSDQAPSWRSERSVYYRLLATRIDKEVCRVDVPKAGQLSCLVGVRKSAYDGFIDDAIVHIREEAHSLDREAQQAMAQGNVAAAVKNWSHAATLLADPNMEWALKTRFSDQMVFGHLRRSVQEHLDQLFSTLRLVPSSEVVHFDKDGRVDKHPSVRLTWADGTPVPNFYLTARLVSGRGKVQSTSRTGEDGVASFEVSSIDPFLPTASLRVETDWAAFQVSTAAIASPRVRIDFERQRSLCIQMAGAENEALQPVLSAVVKGVEGSAWDVFSSGQDCDAVVMVEWNVETSKHPDFDLYRARLSSVVETRMAGRPEKDKRRNGPASSETGTSAEAAHARASQQMAALLPPFVNNLVSELEP